MTSSSTTGSRDTSAQVQQLLKLARAGSNEALGEMLEGCRQYLLLVANEKLAPELNAKTGASDMVQDTFVAAGTHFSHFTGKTEPELLSWLRQILLNHMVTVHRRFVQAQKRSVSREVSLGHHASALRGRDVIDNRSETPSQHALRNERTEEVQYALEALPHRYRSVIQLRHRDQLPFEEVARQLELSPPAARQLWARAVRMLRRML